MQSSIEAFESLESVSLNEFGAYFSNFRTEAFRFEALPVYDVPEEKEYFVNFERGMSCPADFNAEWLQLIKDAAGRNAHFSRVRFIPNQQLTEYLRFEIDWGYKKSAVAGENILILNDKTLERYSSLVPILDDFWLFDRKECFIMRYDIVGRFLGVQRVPKKGIDIYTKLANALLENAVSLEKGPYF